MHVMEYHSVEVDDPFLEDREQLYLDIFLYAAEYLKSKGKDRRFFKLGYNLDPEAKRNRGEYRNPEQVKVLLSENGREIWQRPGYREDHALSMSINAEARRQKRLKTIHEPEFEEWFKQVLIENEVHEGGKKVLLVYNRITGKFVEEYKGVREAGRRLKISRDQIRKVLNGSIKYTNDLFFCEKIIDDYPLQIEPIPQYDDPEERVKIMKESRKKVSIPIIARDLDHNLVGEYESAVHAGKELDILPSGIRSMLYGKSTRAGNYLFEFKDPTYKPRKNNKRQLV